jgi:hypothetical protein
VRSQLKVLRVTGGEPLLSPHTFQLIEEVLNRPNPELNFAFNTNLGLPEKVIAKFIERLKRFKPGQHVRKLEVFTSVDTWGRQAEYIRHGLNFESFWSNLRRLLVELPDVDVIIMCTFNNLSVPQFKTFLQEFHKLRQETHSQRRAAFTISFSHLSYPLHQSMLLLPKEYLVPQMESCLKYIEEHAMEEPGQWSGARWSQHERQTFSRMVELAKNSKHPKLLEERSNFYRFFSEHDRRRGSNFLLTFPELADFWELCKEADKRFYRRVHSSLKATLHHQTRHLDRFF